MALGDRLETGRVKRVRSAAEREERREPDPTGLAVAQQPWVLRKSESEADQARFRTALYVTCEVVRIAALLIQPVMPDSASKLLDLLGQSPEQRSFAAIGARLEPGTALPAPSGVFPRYQVD